MAEYKLYTDGGCAFNPGGPGAAASVIVDENGEFRNIVSSYIETTNNRMELMAVVQGLAEIPEGSRVHLYSDSQYVLNCAFGDWEKKKNTDLWKRFDNIAGKYDIDATWVRGHNGNRLNERCDDLCTRAMRNPTKVDNGYVLMPHDSTSAGSKKTGAMGVEIEIPAEYSPREIVRVRAAEYANLRHVKLPCAKRLLNFLCKKKHSFSDYQNLRTDGIDFWSRKNKEAERTQGACLLEKQQVPASISIRKPDESPEHEPSETAGCISRIHDSVPSERVIQGYLSVRNQKRSRADVQGMGRDM